VCDSAKIVLNLKNVQKTAKNAKKMQKKQVFDVIFGFLYIINVLCEELNKQCDKNCFYSIKHRKIICIFFVKLQARLFDYGN
jgi:hypothetical protein